MPEDSLTDGAGIKPGPTSRQKGCTTPMSRENPGCDATCPNYCLHADYGHKAELEAENARLREALDLAAKANNEGMDLLLKYRRVLEKYAKCDGFCAGGECVCNVMPARNALKQ